MAKTKTPPRRSRPRATRRRKKRAKPTWLAVAAGLVFLLVIGFVARGDSNRGLEGPQTSGGDALAHVHGLGINPADGDLHAATHFGLFRVPDDGKARRVGDAIQDTMGFTIVGGDNFLGSGHPDLQDKRLRARGKPPLLGLIDSTDAGRTWNSCRCWAKRTSTLWSRPTGASTATSRPAAG